MKINPFDNSHRQVFAQIMSEHEDISLVRIVTLDPNLQSRSKNSCWRKTIKYVIVIVTSILRLVGLGLIIGIFLGLLIFAIHGLSSGDVTAKTFEIVIFTSIITSVALLFIYSIVYKLCGYLFALLIFLAQLRAQRQHDDPPQV